MSLEKKVNDAMKTMVVSDLHGQFVDNKAYKIMLQYARDYKPDNFVINGDLLDFYTVSTFDKNPERKENIQYELQAGENIVKNIRKNIGSKAKLYFLEGNHDARLQRFVWRNPELEGLEALELPNLLNLDKYNCKFIGVDNDYWKTDNGHLKIGDMLIMHGDNRLNGASTSKYSGYSAKNTMMGLQNSVLIGHVHRLAQVYHSTPYGELVGMEGGHLAQPTGTANWQQGFVTFETHRGKTVNPQLHHINKGKMYDNGKLYKG